jgi:hypothetical protein
MTFKTALISASAEVAVSGAALGEALATAALRSPHAEFNKATKTNVKLRNKNFRDVICSSELLFRSVHKILERRIFSAPKF